MFGFYKKCVFLGVKIDGSTLKPFSMVQAIRLGKKGLFKDPIPPPRLYWVSIKVFIQGLNKIIAPRTTHHTFLGPEQAQPDYQKARHLAKNMAENDEVVGSGAQLFHKLTNYGLKTIGFVQLGPLRCQFKSVRRRQWMENKRNEAISLVSIKVSSRTSIN